jgi:FkbM family methyltransferase
MANLILEMAEIAARILPDRFKQALYRYPVLARTIRTGLNKAAPVGMTKVKIAAGPLDGKIFTLDLRTEKDYWLGTYEPELLSKVSEFVRPGMVVYDIGANIGYTTVAFALATGHDGQIFAFEALPENVRRLKANLKFNALEERVEVISGAVVDRTDLVRFLIGPSSGMGKVDRSAGRSDITYTDVITVPGIALDDFIFSQNHPIPHIIKIDIEGGEVLAFPGMRRLINEHSPVILLEIHGPEASQVAWDSLMEAGYHLHRLLPGYPVVDSYESLDWKAYLVAKPKFSL